MESLQEKFILNQLINYNSSEMYSKHIDKLGNISRSCISRIFNQKNIISGTDMKALIYLFDTLFLSECKINSREKGLYDLSKTIQKWIKKMIKISVNSKEGFIYITNFSSDIQVVIKVAQKSDGIESKLREYFIGIKSVNKLRSLIPTFVYTIGAFLYPKPTNTGKLQNDKKGENTAFVVYEKIDGETISTLLKKDKLIFKQFLSIFIQLLLGLEVAQREARFTHFDLHTDNVMVRENDVDSYNIHLDMSTYSVVNPEFIPVIIDFGAATCYIENRYIGSYDYIKHGMLNFMVPGYDMYKFLVYCVRKTINQELKQKLISMFRFYGDNEPYNIINNTEGIDKAAEEYCMKVTFSQTATYTPLMFIEWLLKEYLISDILVYERVNYLSLTYSSITKEYDHIFEYIKKGVENAILFTEECALSYVITKYNINLLKTYNDNLQSDDLRRKIKDLNKYLNRFEDKFIDIDNAMLENVFDIKIPTQKDVELCLIKILSIEIPNPSYNIDEKIKLHIEDTIKELDICLSYEYELSPYLQFYFTILEMQLDNKFSDWIKNFTKSDIYKFYSLNVINTQRAKRWGQSLSAYDNENTIVESPIFQKKLSEIKVLTYNVLHEISKIKVCKEDKCLKNICSFIDKNTKNFDFIGIQEYSNIPKMQQYSKELTKMSVTHDEVPEYLKKYGPVTFYDNKKYKLDDSCNTMKFGFSGQLGRGIQINFFNNNLCIINVHAGHEPKDKINMFDKSLKDYLESAFCDKKCKDIFIKKLQTYKIIMLGDMNNNLDNFTYITIADKQRSLYGRTTKPTCCEEKKTMNGKNVEYGAYDHILSTFAKEFVVNVYRPMDLHSDHDPVSSTLTCD